MRTYVPVAAVGYVLVLLIVAAALPLQAVLFVVCYPFDRNRAVAGRFSRLVAVAVTRTFPPWRLSVEGTFPPDGPFVVVANHQSMLDVLLISKVPREMKWIAKESLFKMPWIGWIFRLSGDIPVRRGESESGAEALGKAKRYLANGMSVMLFPEGTRSTRGTMLPFKSGAFRLAVEAGVPVLPIAVSGTAHGMPKGGIWVRPCRAVARILEPVPTAGLGLEDVTRLRDEVRARIEATLPLLPPP